MKARTPKTSRREVLTFTDASSVHSPALPLYLSTFEKIKDAIRHDPDAVGKCLPIERDLGAQLGVSRITVRQALSLLEQQGYIQKIHSKPSRIISRGLQHAGRRQLNTVNDLLDSGLEYRVVLSSYGPARSGLAESVFSGEEGATFHRLALKFYSDSRQVGFSEIYFAPEVGAKLMKDHFLSAIDAGRLHAFKVVENVLGIKAEQVRLTVGADLASQVNSELLASGCGEALVRLHMVFSAGQKPFQMTCTWFDASFYNISYDLKV